MSYFTRFFNSWPKGKNFNSSGVNNSQSVEIPISEAVPSNLKPSFLDNPSAGYNNLNKSGLTSWFQNFNENPKYNAIIENLQRPKEFSCIVNLLKLENNHYLSPPPSPLLSCENDKEMKDIGINTENPFKNEAERNLNKFTTKLLSILIFFFILISFIGIIIIWKIKNISQGNILTKEESRKILFPKKENN